ncbi:MAG: hypothetical protein E7615_06505 [Ruminococcaceae bacterium]|nr:hypothetical protein [Oscillospiraceae bacterium]
MGSFNLNNNKEFRETSSSNLPFTVVNTSKSKPIFISINGKVRVRLLSLSKERDNNVLRRYQALCTCFSQSSNFVLIKDQSILDHFSWLTFPMIFACPEGALVIGIDQYVDGGHYPILGNEDEWDICSFILTNHPKTFCSTIVATMEEVLDMKIYWEVKQDRIIDLFVSHDKSYRDIIRVKDENGIINFIRNPQYEAD